MTVSNTNANKLLSARFFQHFLFGDKWWACFRILFLMISVGIMAIVVAFRAENSISARIWFDIFFPLLIINLCIFGGIYILREIFETEQDASNVLLYSVLLIVVLVVLAFLGYMGFKYFGLNGQPFFRYLLAPLTALIGAFLAGAYYVQDIYNLDNYWAAVLYLLSSFGGIGYPKLIISEGQKKIDSGKINRLELIGGPGHITIRPGNAVLTERLHGPAGVYSAGKFFLSRFEVIVNTLNLEDQHGFVSSVFAVTKDGIAVTVRDIQFRYRVWSGRHVTNTTAGRSAINPYPYTTQAVRYMAYHRNVSADGLTSWHEAVKNVIVGAITGYVAEHQLDQITAPRYVEGDPRKEIGAQLQIPGTRDKLKDIGAQLLWHDIGHFDVENKAVSEQRIDTWKSGWIGNAKVIRAYGDAQRVAYQEIGQAEAQAEVLMSIAHAFDDIDLSTEEKERNISNIILMRTAQVLETLSSTVDNERLVDKEKDKEAKKEDKSL
jgi:hypothetical protein